jgi:hypothetical protein
LPSAERSKRRGTTAWNLRLGRNQAEDNLERPGAEITGILNAVQRGSIPFPRCGGWCPSFGWFSVNKKSDVHRWQWSRQRGQKTNSTERASLPVLENIIEQMFGYVKGEIGKKAQKGRG